MSKMKGTLLRGAVLVGFLAPPLALLAFVQAMRMLTGVPVSLFTRDPAATLGGPFYVGLVSQCGALLWCAAAACCFFGCAATRERAGGEPSRFLLASGLITLLLLLDDLFQLHEDVYRIYLHAPESAVVAVYGGLLAAYLWQFRSMIRRSEYGWLLGAFTLFGVSVAADEAVTLPHFRYLIEDGSKFMGIACWFAYLSRTSLSLVTRGAPIQIGAETAPPEAVMAATRRVRAKGRFAGGRAVCGRAFGRGVGPSPLDLDVLAAFTRAAPTPDEAERPRDFPWDAETEFPRVDIEDRFGCSAAVWETRMT